TLPNGRAQSDDDASGPILFEQFDPSHQVAGGDDAAFPSTGDDAGGLARPAGGGNPIVGGPSGGFEFTFADVSECGRNAWNAFFLNSNGNITFGSGDTDNAP